MKCENCKGEFDFPLELYNGEIACPLCKKAMTLPAVKNNVGQEEDANFNRGEAYYKMSLTCTNAAEKKQYSAMAVESTRLAAQGGHAKAMLRLGYMYSTRYIVADDGVAASIAGRYFERVWKGSSDESLKNKAAAFHRSLFARMGLKKEEISDVLSDMQAAGVTGLSNVADESAIALKDANKLTDAFEACIGGEKKPLFGLILIGSGQDFKNWARSTVKEKGRKITTIEKYLDHKIEMKYALTEDGRTEVFPLGKSVVNSLDREDFLADVTDFYVYFFNNGCERKYRRVGEYLEQNGSERIVDLCGIADSQHQDIICTGDDIEMYRSSMESVRHALKDLLAAMQS